MSIIVQEITSREQWDGFLTSQPGGHLLQAYEWGELSRSLGKRIYRLGALDNGRMVGAMLLSVTPVPLPKLIPGLRFNWLYCSRGPTVEDPHAPALAALVEHAHTIAQQERAVVLRLEPNIAEDDPDFNTWMTVYDKLGFHTYPFSVHGRRSWVLDIRPDMDHLFANFQKGWRQDIRIAERLGVKVRAVESEADFDTYYELLKITSQRDGFFIHSKEYHREMLQRFARKGDAILYLAELEGEPLAAKMLIRFGNWCWDMFGATTSNHQNVPKTHLLQYHCLQWAKAKGCAFFDFRTIPEILEPGEELWGVYQFKKGFGGCSRLHMPTQDYVYRPLIYTAWGKVVEVRRARRRKAHKEMYRERTPRVEMNSLPRTQYS